MSLCTTVQMTLASKLLTVKRQTVVYRTQHGQVNNPQYAIAWGCARGKAFYLGVLTVTSGAM